MDSKNIRTLVQLGHFTDQQTKDKKAVTDLSSHIFLVYTSLLSSQKKQ